MHRKLLVLTALLIALVSTAYAAQLAGRWSGSLESPVGPLEVVYELAQKGEAVTGTLEIELGNFPITDGVVRGDSVLFKVDIGPVVFSHRGALVGDTLFLAVHDGTVEMPTATLSK